MARKNYTEEFRRQAVDLYESTPGATFQAIAADLGIARGTLQNWVRALGAGTTVTRGTPPSVASGLGRSESQAARIARLEAELAAERVERNKLETERDILRSAAKYFAGETNW